jgi:hypothetical protein
MSESAITQQFSKMIQTIESETKTLKCLVNLRDAMHSRCPDAILDRLRNLESTLINLEHNLDDFDTFLDQELCAVNQLDLMEEQSKRQQELILAMAQQIPSFLKNKAPATQTNQSSVDKHIIPCSDTVIDIQEFESVPKSTRSRLTLPQIMHQYDCITTMILTKGEVNRTSIALQLHLNVSNL